MKMKCIFKFIICLITIRYIKSKNLTEPQNDLYSDSIISHIYNKLKQYSPKNHLINNTNQTDLEPIFEPDLYYRATTNEMNTKIITKILTEMINETVHDNTTQIRTEVTQELTSNSAKFNSSQTTGETITSETKLNYFSTNKSTATNNSIDDIIPAIPGIPIFREPPEIKIHDPDEGPLDPYHHPPNQSHEYPATSITDQQFIFIKTPEFEAERGSLEEKYKHLFSDKNDDDITLPPGFDGEDISNHTETEKIILTTTTTTIEPENTSIDNYFVPQVPYSYGYPYDLYMYKFAPLVPSYYFQQNIRPPFISPLYSGYYQKGNIGKQQTSVKAANSQSTQKLDIHKEKVDPRYRFLPKSYATYGAPIEQVSIEDKGFKHLTAGREDLLQVFEPLESRQEKEEFNKMIQNVAKKATITNMNHENKLLNKYSNNIHNNIRTRGNVPKKQVNNELNNRKFAAVNTNSKRTTNQTNKSRSSNKSSKTRNTKRINTRYPNIAVKKKKKTNNKFPKFMDSDRKKNKLIGTESYGFNKPYIYSPFDTTLSPLDMHSIITMSPSLTHMIPALNPSLMKRYNNRRFISRQQSSRPLIKKSRNKNSVQMSRKKNVKNPKTTHSTAGRRKESTIKRDPMSKVDWKQTTIPKFLLRAKLRNINQLTDDRTTTNKWWNLEQPSYCLDPIYVINDCKNRKLTKRWSYSASDKRCYFYEDYCWPVTNNSFLTSRECFQKCWRVGQSDSKIESSTNQVLI